MVAGVFSLLWLILRSGAKPSRLAYPCQQAAVSAAMLAFGAPLVGAVMAARGRLLAGLRASPAMAAGVGLVVTVGVWAYLAGADDYQGPRLDPPAGFRSDVFHVRDCPQEPIGDRFVGLDNLINLMGRGGLKLYQSATESLVSGPDGLIAADDVVVVKINYQWPERGGTNTDVLRGLLLRITGHPDGFVGEVVVCENAQFNSTSSFDRPENNAQDHGQSPHDVVQTFQDRGFAVSHYDWTLTRGISVGEYIDADMRDGYVVYPPDAQLNGKISYPKFQATSGTYISLRLGIWDPDGGTYDREHLKFINVPVLKSHHATYGATACVKHYMGVVTGSLATNSHTAIRYGLLGALLGEIQLADLNILDAIWINANPYDGPWTTYEAATRRDELLASADPVAADLWGVKFILIPGFLENGHQPPWPLPSADPDLPGSDFRTYLDRSMNYILAAGYEVTNDLNNIDAHSWDGYGDTDGDSDVDLSDYAVLADCLTGPNQPPGLGCRPADADHDVDVDLSDFADFQSVYTGSGIF